MALADGELRESTASDQYRTMTMRMHGFQRGGLAEY